ncbi:MAG: DegT/DnrJ/EryC1/StrS family aminotransferase [Planctomycetota bacterium]
MIGGFGMAVECFSFHATKVLNSFEGGAVTTDDDELAERMRFMRNFGFAGKDRVEYLGSNGKMDEMCAAMGLTSLDSLPEFIEANRRNYGYWREGLAGIPGLAVFEHGEREHHNFHYVVIEVEESEAGLTRDELVRVLEADNVLARRYFFPGVHRMQPYSALQPQAWRVLPETERLCGRVMTVPTGTAVQRADIQRMCGLIRRAVSQSERVRARLAQG